MEKIVFYNGEKAVGEIEMVFVEGGRFSMKDEKGSEFYIEEELGYYAIRLSDYQISKYPVTQKLWKEIMGDYPSKIIGDNNPVDSVSWFDAVAFCNELSSRANLEPYYNIKGEDISINKKANGFCLPTEAQWEFAARGGNKSKGYEYAGSNNIDDVAWYGKNSKQKTHAVGEKQANELGIYDMSGNIWEWCWDWAFTYIVSIEERVHIDPIGPPSSILDEYKVDRRICRGGSWGSISQYCRVIDRYSHHPDSSDIGLGFRVVSR